MLFSYTEKETCVEGVIELVRVVCPCVYAVVSLLHRFAARAEVLGVVFQPETRVSNVNVAQGMRTQQCHYGYAIKKKN